MDTLTSAPFTELDRPNFTGSFYSATKAPIESILKHYPSTLILRLRMPVSADLSPRSFVTKILAYAHIVNVPNSHSILPELLPVLVALAEHREEGVFNFTNPGYITHNEVLQLYKQVVDPSTTWKNFTVEQQAEVIVAERSNCALDTAKLEGKVKQYQGEGVEVELPEVREAYRRCFEVIKKNLGGVQQRAGA
jgi:dTDP-4-dehydrorhamnose reductase